MIITAKMYEYLIDDIARIKVGVCACFVLLLIIAAVYIVEKVKE